MLPITDLYTYDRDLQVIAFKLTKSAADADDLVQETYCRAIQNKDKFVEGTNLGAWLYVMMRRLYLTSDEKRKVVLRYQDSPRLHSGIAPDPQSAHNLSPDEYLDRHAFNKEVQEALENLPPIFRTAVTLCDLEDFTYEEIARKMGTPAGTVMSRISRGRARLKKELHEYAVELGLVQEP